MILFAMRVVFTCVCWTHGIKIVFVFRAHCDEDAVGICKCFITEKRKKKIKEIMITNKIKDNTIMIIEARSMINTMTAKQNIVDNTIQ